MFDNMDVYDFRVLSDIGIDLDGVEMLKKRKHRMVLADIPDGKKVYVPLTAAYEDTLYLGRLSMKKLFNMLKKSKINIPMINTRAIIITDIQKFKFTRFFSISRSF